MYYISELSEDYQIEELAKVGFTPAGIAVLLALKHTYSKQAEMHQPEEYRRLEFARWLVATGKLSEQ